MEINFLQEYQNKKKQIKIFVENSFSRNWINQADYEKILDKIDKDLLTIGVIGQMKSGKSTFLNALLFGKEILPAATTPMTAALSVITYGDEEKIEIEFYSQEEWQEIKMLANNSTTIEDGNEELASKIKVAKELVNKSLSLGNSLENLLGNAQIDAIDNLINYVGANGKYVAITKSVTVYHPTEWLKGIRIVDTPGFNDPVVSREARTQEFLKLADVVIVLLYAGRAFDSTDKEIIFERVRSVGIGKILIAINKYDINYSQGETAESMIENVKSEINNALAEANDSTMTNLLGDINPIPMSAQMALLSKLPLAEINNSEDKKFHWDNLTSEFEISSQAQLFEKSLVKNLEDAIVETIEKEKIDILFKKPVQYIMRQGEKNEIENESKLNTAKELLNSLKLSDDELEERIEELKKVKDKISKSIDQTLTDLNEELHEKIKAINNDLIDFVIKAKKDINNKIDNASYFKENKTERDINSYFDNDLFININKKLEANTDNLKKILINGTLQLSQKIKRDLNRKVSNPEELIENLEYALKKIKSELEDDQFNEQESEPESAIFQNIMDFFKGFAQGFSNSWKNLLRQDIDELFFRINNELPYLKDKFYKLKDQLLEKFDAEAIENILSSFIEELEQAKMSLEAKNKKIEEQERIIEEVEKEQRNIRNQICEMKELKSSLNL